MDTNSLDKIDKIKNHIKSYPDFPKPGIIFRDMLPLFEDPNIMHDVYSILENHIQDSNIKFDCIVGIEARGFIIGPTLAYLLKVPFIPIRKAGKLPGRVESLSYELEYGSDKIEIQLDSLKPKSKCLVIDDLLATGGSVRTAIELIQKCNAEVSQVIVLIELIDLKGREQYKAPTFSLVQY